MVVCWVRNDLLNQQLETNVQEAHDLTGLFVHKHLHCLRAQTKEIMNLLAA